MNGKDFSVTFGICNSGNSEYLYKIVNSIHDQKIPDFEIHMIGNKLGRWSGDKIFCHDFDETIKPGWITKKKNILCAAANKEYTVLIHDYVKFDAGWYQAWKKFETPGLNLGMNKVWTLEGERSADWLVSPLYMDMILKQFPEMGDMLMASAPHENHPKYVCGLPYDEMRLNRFQYVSGGFIFGRTQTLQFIKQPENLGWGEAEDVQWSLDACTMCKDTYYMNRDASVTLLKPNKWKVTEMPKEAVDIIYEWEYGEKRA